MLTLRCVPVVLRCVLAELLDWAEPVLLLDTTRVPLLVAVRLGPLVLLGRSYVEPDDWVLLDVAELLLTLRDALERLSVAGVTVLTAVLLVDLDATRAGPLAVELLRVCTLSPSRPGLSVDALAIVLAAELPLPPALPLRLTTRLGPDVLDAKLSDGRLRFLSHPPPLILRLGT